MNKCPVYTYDMFSEVCRIEKLNENIIECRQKRIYNFFVYTSSVYETYSVAIYIKCAHICENIYAK